MIDCIVIPTERATVFRQAKENTARRGLSAIAMARQVALLLLAVNGYEIPDYAINNDFYRQALELRIPRGEAQELYAAMGGFNKRRFSQYKDLLRLCDEAIELADRYRIDEGILRYVTNLVEEDQVEMIQQIIQLGLSGKQVEAIIDQVSRENSEEANEDLPTFVTRFARSFIKDADKFSSELLWAAVYQEQGDPHMASAYLKRLAQMALSAAALHSDEGDKSTRVDL